MQIYDAFISHAASDRDLALVVCESLEERGLSCFLAPRDMLPGTSYAQRILEGIQCSRGMVLIFSSAANQSPHVIREVERAASGGLSILAIRVEEIPLNRTLEYFLSSLHWLTASIPFSSGTLKKIAEAVDRWREVKCGSMESTIASEAAPPVYNLNISDNLQGELWRSGVEWFRNILQRGIDSKSAGRDIANEVSEALRREPVMEGGEVKILRLAENLFRRPAFYSHPERN